MVGVRKGVLGLEPRVSNLVPGPFLLRKGCGNVKIGQILIKQSMPRKDTVQHDPKQTYLRIMSGTERDGSRSHQWQCVREYMLWLNVLMVPTVGILFHITRGWYHVSCVGLKNVLGIRN